VQRRVLVVDEDRDLAAVGFDDVRRELEILGCDLDVAGLGRRRVVGDSAYHCDGDHQKNQGNRCSAHEANPSGGAVASRRSDCRHEVAQGKNHQHTAHHEIDS